MQSLGLLAFSLLPLLFFTHPAGTQNLTCALGSSLDLCVDVPSTDGFSYFLLWSASRRKGLALLVPEEPLYVVSPLFSGRITLVENHNLRIQHFGQSDAGIYEVVRRSPGATNESLLREQTVYVLNISVAEDPQADLSCSMALYCGSLVGGHPEASRVPEYRLLIGYWAGKVILMPPPLFFFYYYCLKRASRAQGKKRTLETSPVDPEVLGEAESRNPYHDS